MLVAIVFSRGGPGGGRARKPPGWPRLEAAPTATVGSPNLDLPGGLADQVLSVETKTVFGAFGGFETQLLCLLLINTNLVFEHSLCVQTQILVLGDKAVFSCV